MANHSVIRVDDLAENKLAYMSASKEYYLVYVVTQTGKRIPCLLTEDDVTKGIDRADRNFEDVIPLSIGQKIYHFLLDLLR